ncbi:MAG: 50S ribosomal protein L15 [Chlamydiae bacterium RIFCSPHIGHO2_12_FULL_27_8]|nr:MAG: 50S ribosomal protein L15 [Chlamydiae bacterium RIFCSPHIGHO2_12_FULL_27_8]OGN64930.1 MAG: 50S ribosomal protein L15 [Chlamydiae bacterium RIFCSPLOWO2_01_FULL_28_7]
MKLSELKNTHYARKSKKLVGRGNGCGKGKTCGRGHKGAKSRSGYKSHYGYEGGQMRLFKKLPTKGFTRGRFLEKVIAINFDKINKLYNDGETVSIQTLSEKKYVNKNFKGKLKILSNGLIEKKVSFEANNFSKLAIIKIEEKKLKYKAI